MFTRGNEASYCLAVIQYALSNLTRYTSISPTIDKHPPMNLVMATTT